MPMPMMEVRKMGMLVGQDGMPVQMAVRFAAIPVEIAIKGVSIEIVFIRQKS